MPCSVTLWSGGLGGNSPSGTLPSPPCPPAGAFWSGAVDSFVVGIVSVPSSVSASLAPPLKRLSGRLLNVAQAAGHRVVSAARHPARVGCAPTRGDGAATRCAAVSYCSGGRLTG